MIQFRTLNSFKAFSIRLKLYTLGVLLVFPSVVWAQQDWEKDGGIPNAEIQIIKDRQITLPPADRLFDKIPPRPAEPIKPEIIYQFRNLRFSTPDFNPAIRPLKLKQEDISRIYGNFITAGLGNYSSPYAEAYVTSKRNEHQFYGAHFFHHSFGTGPVGGKNSASGTTELSVFGKAMSKVVAASGEINFENRNTYFYGYPTGTEPIRDNIRQSYNIISLGAGIENAKAAAFNYTLKGTYSYLNDHYLASEGEVGLAFNSVTKINQQSRLVLNADYFLIDRKDSLPGIKPRSLFRIKPSFQFTPVDNLWLTVGFNAASENDNIGNSKSFHVYPNLRADYNLNESVAAYAVLTGDIDKVNLHSLSRENIWVNSNISIYHTNRSAEFISGLKGKLGKKVSFGAGFGVANLKNLYFFKNDSINHAKFDVVYDEGNTQRLNLFGEMGYQQSEAVKIALRGDYYQYSTDKVPVAYHRPTYRVTFNSSYNFAGKVLLNVDLIAQGGSKAYDYLSLKTVTLKSAVDLNTRVDYFISKRVSAFVKLNNLLSNQYQVYLNYPVRGFQAMGGVAWSF